MSRQGRFFLVTMVLLLTAGAALALPRSARDVPLLVPLESLPTTLGAWRPAEPPPDEILPRDPRATESLARGYTDGARTAWVAVGFYPNQTEGRRPATGSLVFPGSGWTDLREETVSIPVSGAAASALPANLVRVRRADRRVAILYWYHLPGGTVGSDHVYRARLLWNRIAHRRADGALVRVAMPQPADVSAAAVVAEQTEFLRVFLPELARSLPR
jgi:EpsI family protein